MSYKFGDILENGYASENNPHKIGIFVRETSKGYLMTDGEGYFWERSKPNDKIKVLGSVINSDKLKEGK